MEKKSHFGEVDNGCGICYTLIMNYMNDFDIARALTTNRHVVLNKAARFLEAFKWQVDANSDGWAYWNAPVAAANKLMELIQGKVEPTEANYQKALTPIKTFMTRKGNAAGMQFPEIIS